MTLATRWLAGVLATTSALHAEPPAPACLPPRASSCEPHAKKDVAARAVPPALHIPALTMFSIHTREAIALEPAAAVAERELLTRFFRDRTNWEAHEVAPECVAMIRRACAVLHGRRVEVVSGYRSDKLNEMLRKKGHRVAPRSQHTLGRAVDFRIVGVEGSELSAFARRVHDGGVGTYLASDFVHVDAGARRRWRGE